MKLTVALTLAVKLALLGICSTTLAVAQSTDEEHSSQDTPMQMDEFPMDMGDFDIDEQGDQEDVEQQTSFVDEYLLEPLRVSLRHEVSRARSPKSGLVNNRSSVQLEYSRFFFNKFFVQFDSKYTKFWGADHRYNAESSKVNTKDAFVQASYGDTSVKLGIQTLIWGESEAGAITDIISPRNASELFYINLEESRLGQFMIDVDQFTDYGHFSVFYAPNPDFDQLPPQGSAYHFELPLEVTAGTIGDDGGEWGASWKKKLGQVDVKLMAASVLDNTYAFVRSPTDNSSDTGSADSLDKVKHRYRMLGMTFNYATGDYLISGEIARKTGKAFNDMFFNLYEKDVTESGIKFEYSLAGNDTLAIELVNSHVNAFDSRIVGVPKDNNSLVINYQKYLFNDDLSINWLAIYTRPFDSVQHSIYSFYQWDDQLTLHLDAHYFDTDDERNSLYSYKDQQQLIFKIAYQF